MYIMQNIKYRSMDVTMVKQAKEKQWGEAKQNLEALLGNLPVR